MKKFREFLDEAAAETVKGHKVGDHVQSLFHVPASSAKPAENHAFHGKVTKVTKHKFHVKWNGGDSETVHHASSGKNVEGGKMHGSAFRNIIPGNARATGKEYVAHDKSTTKHHNPE